MTDSGDPDQTLNALVRQMTERLSTPTVVRFGWPRVVLIALVLVVLLLVAFLLSLFIPSDRVGAFAAILSGLGALAVAVLTVFLLVLNQRLISATAQMAQATAAEALATLAEAQASARSVDVANRTVDAMQLDQELAWRPYLLSNRSMGSAIAFVRNVGRGPALRVLYLERFLPGQWWVGGPISIAVTTHAPSQFDLREMPNAVPKELLGHQPTPEVVMVCCDQFGNWLRFEPWRPAAVAWRPGSETPKPDWVKWIETFGEGPDTRPPGQDEYGQPAVPDA